MRSLGVNSHMVAPEVFKITHLYGTHTLTSYLDDEFVLDGYKRMVV